MAQVQLSADMIEGPDATFQLHVTVTRTTNKGMQNDCSSKEQILLKQTIDLGSTINHANPGSVVRPSVLPEGLAVSKTISPRALAPSKPTQAHIFNFPGLAPELRNMVYKHLVPNRLSHQDASLKFESPGGLLLANKQIYSEVQSSINDATYRLSFALCPSGCLCRDRDRLVANRFLKQYVRQIPDTGMLLELHLRNTPVPLAPGHKSALSRFHKIEICFDASGAKTRSTGSINIPEIVESFAPIIADAMLQDPRRSTHLTLRWIFPIESAQHPKTDRHHLDQLYQWFKQLRRFRLNATIYKKTIRHAGVVHEIMAKMHLLRR